MVLLHYGYTMCRVGFICFRPSQLLCVRIMFIIYRYIKCLSIFTVLSPSSGIISGASVIKASKPIGGAWITLSFLWLLLVPWAAVMIFLVRNLKE